MTVTCPQFSTCRNDLRRQRIECVCHEGYRQTSDGLCVDVNECVERPRNPCLPGECLNLPGRFACRCPPGYLLDTTVPREPRCIDEDECAVFNPCEPGTCENIVGGYACICPRGFAFLNGRCEDINECHEQPQACTPGTCVNTIGSYACLCPIGFVVTSPDDHRPACIDVNECAHQPGPCTPGECLNTIGSYSCDCPQGYSLHAGTCIDINECSPFNPCRRGDCVNTDGGFYCRCFEGYTYDEARGTCIGE